LISSAAELPDRAEGGVEQQARFEPKALARMLISGWFIAAS